VVHLPGEFGVGDDLKVPFHLIEERWALVSNAAQRSLEKTLVIAFLGSASAGKDSAIRALFGIDFGDIDPIPGSTERVRIAPVDAKGNVLVVNAPGFGDLRATVEAQARNVVEHMDIGVYVVNADGGASIDEKKDLQALRATGRPVLVCLNKIDLIRPHQRESFVRATLLQLGVEPHDAVVTAFDPLPALSRERLGVEPTIAWIHTKLDEQGKALLFAKQLRNKVAATEVVIQSAARMAAFAGAVPFPGADMAAVTAVQMKLISDLATVFGQRLDKDAVLFLLGELLAGTSKGFIRWGIGALKAAGWIPGAGVAEMAASALGATVASATTYGIGKATVSWLTRNRQLSGDELRDVFDHEAEAYRDDPTKRGES
jgi:uncharacterized protein (DUF697 family)/GTP-binding protein EngB required for normal cell division